MTEIRKEREKDITGINKERKKETEAGPIHSERENAIITKAITEGRTAGIHVN